MIFETVEVRDKIRPLAELKNEEKFDRLGREIRNIYLKKGRWQHRGKIITWFLPTWKILRIFILSLYLEKIR